MSLSIKVAKLGSALGLTVLAAACGPAGSAATGGIDPKTGAPRKDRGSLRARNTTENMWTAGANVFRWTVFYEGGPNESWAFDARGGTPPDLEGKPGYSHEDDPDVEVLPAEGGAPSVPLEVPAFCDNYSGVGVEMDFDRMHKGFLEMKDTAAVLGDLRTVAWGACDRAHYEPRQKRVQRLLQTFVNETKMPLAELAKLLEALATSTPKESFCGSDPTTRWLTCGDAPKGGPLPAIAKLDMMEMAGEALEEERFHIAMSKFVWATPQPFQTDIPWKGAARVTGIGLRLAPAEFTMAGLSPDSARRSFAEASVAAVEIEGIEWDALGLTLLAKEKNVVTKYLLERRLAEWRTTIEKSVASLGSRVAKAKTIEEAWRKDVLGPNKEGLKAAFTAIQTPTSKEACATVESSVTKAITAKAPKSWKEATALLADPAIDVLLQARQKCHDAGGEKALAKVEEQMLERWGRRALGPRVTAYRELDEWPQMRSYFDAPSARTVKSASVKGDMVELGFEPEEWMEARESCVETRTIDGITWEGKIVYRVNCTSLEPLKHRDPLPPATLPKAVAAGLKKGHVVTLVEDSGKASLLIAYPDKKAAESDSKLGVFMGIVLTP